jgi:segregation and condensation protein A
MTPDDPFEEDGSEGGRDVEHGETEAQLVVDLEGFEGPLDVLLTLAREQKVDLTRLSILELANQYLAFIARARTLRLEIAADYLVMAAWLAYLKSRLLLPQPSEEEPTAEQMAAALAFQLQRLEAMRQAGVRLMSRPRLGIDIFARGAPEGLRTVRARVFEVTLYDLLTAYGTQHRRQTGGTLHILPSEIYSMDDALQRLTRLLGGAPEWQSLVSFLPGDLKGGLVARSALAATFAASLELARSGRVRLRQNSPFGPIYVRTRTPEAASESGPVGGDGGL